MNTANAAPALPQARAGQAFRHEFTLLIQVPALPDLRDSASPAGKKARIRIESDPRRPRPAHPRRRPRRRLKREVKVAACLMACCLPLIYHISTAWSERMGNIATTDLTRTVDPDDGKESRGFGTSLARKVSRSVFEPAVVLMSIEPAQSGLKPKAEPPVVFPGYLLPEDSLEEMAHEGS